MGTRHTGSIQTQVSKTRPGAPGFSCWKEKSVASATLFSFVAEQVRNETIDNREGKAETVKWKTMLSRILSQGAAKVAGLAAHSAVHDGMALAAAGVEGAQRKTVPLPSILGPVRPPNALLPKGSPGNLRRFAESPVPRRAINVIKDRIACMDWQIRLRRGYTLENVPDAQARMDILRRTLEEPNNSDSFRSVVEQAMEDALVGGFGAIEMEKTDDPERPFALWPVDGATIQLNANWNGDADSPRYAQNTNRVGPGSQYMPA